MDSSLTYLIDLLRQENNQGITDNGAHCLCLFCKATHEGEVTRMQDNLSMVRWAKVTPHRAGLDVASVLYRFPVVIMVQIVGAGPVTCRPSEPGTLIIQWLCENGSKDVHYRLKDCRQVLETGNEGSKLTIFYVARDVEGPVSGLAPEYLAAKGGTQWEDQEADEDLLSR